MLNFHERVAVGGLMLLAAWVIMGDGILGLANSGDFGRVMAWGGLDYPAGLPDAEKYFNWVVPELNYRWWPPLAPGWYLTSEAPIVKLAATLGWLADTRHFDLRWLGVVHLVLFGGALSLLMIGWRRATGLTGLFLVPGLALVFCDAGYLVYFQAFFSESAALIFLLATTGLGLAVAAAPPSRGLVTAFFSALVLFMASKAQTMALAAPILLYVASLWFTAGNAPWRARLPRWALGIAALALVQYLVTPPNMIEANRFATVFNGILRDSPTPEQDLRDLGLPVEYAKLAGYDIFNERQPIDIWSLTFRREFHEVHSHRKVAFFYLTHPRRFASKMAVSAEHAFSLRPTYLGNTTLASGTPGNTLTTRYTTWSRFKDEQLPHTLPFVVGAIVLALGGLGTAVLRDRGVLRRGPATFLAALALMAVIAFVTPILGDGQSDIDKHMFLFDALFDLGVVLATALLAGGLWRTVRPVS